MATEVVKIVDPDNGPGTDYTSLADFVSNEARNLVSEDEIAVAKCRCTGGTADTTPVNITGFTTDGTRYIKVYTDPFEGYRHNGLYQTGNKYRLVNGGTSDILTIAQNHVYIEGLQIIYTGTTTSCKTIRISSNYYGCHVRKNISYTTQAIAAGAFWFPGFVTTAGGVSNFCYNNIIIMGSQYNHPNNSCIGVDSHPNETAWNLWIFNNTLVGGAYSIYNDDPHNSVFAYNNILYNQVNDPYVVNNSDSDYNSTDRSVALGGANDRVSQTFSFENPGGLDYHLKYYDQGALRHGYVDPYGGGGLYTDDIDGESRPASGPGTKPWDIGADQFVNDIPVNRQWVLAMGHTLEWTEVIDVYVLRDGVFVPDKIIKILDTGSWI